MKEHKNRSRRKYKFTDKRQSVGGIFSTMLGIMAVSFFLTAIFISYRQKGNGGREIGFLGIMSLFLSSIGLYIGTNIFQEENLFYLFSWLGAIINAIMLVGMGMVFLIGL